MYRFAWYLLAMAFVSASARCPEDCVCNESGSVAECRSLTTMFDPEVRVLKVVSPTKRLNITSELFESLGLLSLNKLLIENALFESFGRKPFRMLSDLTTIKIANSILPPIENDLFEESLNLKSVSFSGSLLLNLGYITSETIEELDLSNCSIESVSRRNFDGLPELVYLNLARNSISRLAANTFTNLISLEELDLSFNQLEQIPTNIFDNTTQLDTLDLSHNPLKSFAISTVSDLEKLILKSCRLTEIDETIGSNLDLLSYLDMSWNNITSVNADTFANLKELEVLDLSHNKLRTLGQDVFKSNFKLQKIILDGNSLKTLPSFVSNEAGFRTTFFSCNDCHLKLLTEDTFVNMPGLIILRLNNNKLEKAHFLKKLHSLSELDLSYNNIRTIDEKEFTKSSALENINLSGNPLGSLNPQIFKKNAILTKLNVSSCGLTKLWTVADSSYSLPSLKQLILANNDIKTISLEDLILLKNLAVFDIKGNPLACGDVFCNLIEWLNDHDILHTAASSELVATNASNISDFEIQKSPWASIVNASCGKVDTCDYDYDYEDSEYDTDVKEAPNDDEKETIFDNMEIDVTEFEDDIEPRGMLQRYSLVYPALVFVCTALLVLLIVANVLIFLLRRRGAPRMPMDSLPQIKIIPWSNGTKLKKHSGSVYQPLSEERNGPKTPVIGRRYEQVPTGPEVHKSTP